MTPPCDVQTHKNDKYHIHSSTLSDYVVNISEISFVKGTSIWKTECFAFIMKKCKYVTYPLPEEGCSFLFLFCCKRSVCLSNRTAIKTNWDQDQTVRNNDIRKQDRPARIRERQNNILTLRLIRHRFKTSGQWGPGRSNRTQQDKNAPSKYNRKSI